jgi:hypothetical protein
MVELARQLQEDPMSNRAEGPCESIASSKEHVIPKSSTAESESELASFMMGHVSLCND